MILAGIVLYNPDLTRLTENVNAIKMQDVDVVFFDNGSNNVSLVEEIFPEIQIIKSETNKGISLALNELFRYAVRESKYDWVLTLDQDSVVSDDLISVYQNLIRQLPDNLSIICPKIQDRNANLKRETTESDGYVDLCITSGCLNRVSAWQDINGFDESMFIDGVDFDFCIRLIKKGWKIFKTNQTYILHEVGRSKVIKILGKEYLSLNHSPFRYYYIIRNQIYLGRKHNQLFRQILVTARMFYTVILYENQKTDKLKRMCKGLFDGLCMKIVK